jgi:hypothetical protein
MIFLLWPQLLPAFFLNSPWFLCPFEILAEVSKMWKIYGFILLLPHCTECDFLPVRISYFYNIIFQLLCSFWFFLVNKIKSILMKCFKGVLVRKVHERYTRFLYFPVMICIPHTACYLHTCQNYIHHDWLMQKLQNCMWTSPKYTIFKKYMRQPLAALGSPLSNLIPGIFRIILHLEWGWTMAILVAASVVCTSWRQQMEYL